MTVKKIFTYQIKNPIANLIWLALLGYVCYIFVFISYAASQAHSDFGRFYAEIVAGNQLSFIWALIAILFLEVFLNFPSKHWYVRVWFGICAIVVLVESLPVL